MLSNNFWRRQLFLIVFHLHVHGFVKRYQLLTCTLDIQTELFLWIIIRAVIKCHYISRPIGNWTQGFPSMGKSKFPTCSMAVIHFFCFLFLLWLSCDLWWVVFSYNRAPLGARERQSQLPQLYMWPPWPARPSSWHARDPISLFLPPVWPTHRKTPVKLQR